MGSVYLNTENSYNIYKDRENQIIQLKEVANKLVITWKFKWLQNEVVYEKEIDAREILSESDQTTVGNEIVNEMTEVKRKHIAKIQRHIISDISPEEKSE